MLEWRSMKSPGPISDYLAQRLSGRGDQTRFSRSTGISKGITSQWISGQAVPNFENCLVIAHHFNDDPAMVIGMTGKTKYLERYQAMMAHAADPGNPAYTVNSLHRELHRKLQAILDAGPESELVIQWNVETIYDRIMHSRSTRRFLQARSN